MLILMHCVELTAVVVQIKMMDDAKVMDAFFPHFFSFRWESEQV